MENNNTCGHAIVQKFEMCNNIGSSNLLDFTRDESDVYNIWTDDEFNDH